jgi:hypothetical protein
MHVLPQMNLSIENTRLHTLQHRDLTLNSQSRVGQIGELASAKRHCKLLVSLALSRRSNRIEEHDEKSRYRPQEDGQEKPVKASTALALGQAGIDEHQRSPTNCEFTTLLIHLGSSGQ